MLLYNPGSGQYVAQIKIESDTSWGGSIGSMEEGWRTVQGHGDKTFDVKGSIISCCVQKDTVEGYLRVSIIKDGKTVKQQPTAAYGVVSLGD